MPFLRNRVLFLIQNSIFVFSLSRECYIEIIEAHFLRSCKIDQLCVAHFYNAVLNGALERANKAKQTLRAPVLKAHLSKALCQSFYSLHTYLPKRGRDGQSWICHVAVIGWQLRDASRCGNKIARTCARPGVVTVPIGFERMQRKSMI